jgi:hypothetical protein
MHGELEREANDLAAEWAERYGAVARVRAALAACEAMESYDLSACVFWRLVLDHLDSQLRPVPWTQ